MEFCSIYIHEENGCNGIFKEEGGSFRGKITCMHCGKVFQNKDIHKLRRSRIIKVSIVPKSFYELCCEVNNPDGGSSNQTYLVG